MPDDRLHPLLFSIEQATVQTAREYPKLVDKEVEAVYEQYRAYFRELKSGHESAEPTSTITRKEELLNRIWESLLLREELGADENLLDGSFSPGGRPMEALEELYVLAFKELRNSCRFWRKRSGPKGYVKHITEHMPG